MSRRSLADMGYKGGPANLSELADYLDVSVSTVSRALRGAKGVHSATRARVLEACKRLGYGQMGDPEGTQPEPRMLMVFAQASGPVRIQDYLAGISKASMMYDCSILTHYLPAVQCEDLLDVAQQPPAMRLGQVDGVLFLLGWPERVVAQVATQCPVVSLIHQYEALCDHVGLRDESGMLSIVRHLFGLGHRKIGFFGLCSEVAWSRARYGAYAEALEVLGLRFDAGCVLRISREEALSEGIFDAGEYASEVARLRGEGVTAWVTACDTFCYSLMASVIDLGLRVPQDISVTGFHTQRDPPPNLPLATSVVVDPEELGFAAVRRLLRRLEEPTESFRSILLPCSLSIGESTAQACLVT